MVLTMWKEGKFQKVETAELVARPDATQDVTVRDRSTAFVHPLDL